MGKFEGKVVVITGGASGIGAAAARRFAGEGATLVLADLNEDALGEQRETLGLSLGGHRLLTRKVDVSQQADIDGLIETTIAEFGHLDVLVNNAGVGSFGYVTEITPEEWRRVFAIDLDAVYFACRAAMPHLIAARGNIVNTASISGIAGDYGFAAYNAAKAGVINMTRTLALDHGKDGVRVNAISPGLVQTPLAAALHTDNRIMAEYARTVPLARAGQPDEMAAAIQFLASDDASYITGINLVVDGGLTAHTGQPNFHRFFREQA